MFSNLGWAEVGVIIVVGIIVVGPERLPSVIQEVRTVIKNLRKGIDSARGQFDEEFGDLSKDIQEFAQPIQELNNLRGMSPQKIITKTLFDGDSSYVEQLDELGKTVQQQLSADSGSTQYQSQQAVADIPTPSEPFVQNNPVHMSELNSEVVEPVDIHTIDLDEDEEVL